MEKEEKEKRFFIIHLPKEKSQCCFFDITKSREKSYFVRITDLKEKREIEKYVLIMPT